MDDSDLSACSTPIRKSLMLSPIDAISDDSFCRGDKSTGVVEIPASEPEDNSSGQSFIEDSFSSDVVKASPIEVRKVSKPKQASLLRKSLGFQSALEDNLNNSSLYMSFQSAATVSPENGTSRNKSSSQSGEHESDISRSSFGGSNISEENSSHEDEEEIESTNSEDSDGDSLDESVIGQKKKPVGANGVLSDDSDDSSTSPQPELYIQSDNSVGPNNSVPSSPQPEIEEDDDEYVPSRNSVGGDVVSGNDVNLPENQGEVESDEDIVVNSVASLAPRDGLNGHLPESIGYTEPSNVSSFHDDEDNDGAMSGDSSNMNGAVSDNDKDSVIEFSGSPRRSNVIDLTQSDSSLQNSPVGATRQHGLKQRSVADIVAELSTVSNDIMVKEALLDSINVQTLPDNGRNLTMKVSELKSRKIELEKELNNNDEYAEQKATVELMRSNLEKKLLTSKQSTLNFQPSVKMEPRDYESNESREDGSPNSVSSHSSNSKPNWGDLPNPDMTISNFGKRAMETHLAEKSVTLEALSSLHNALKTCPSEDTHAEDPKYLKVELMPHQKHGLAWMLWREQEKPSGGILADDMGLGKTLSMIALILKSAESKENSDDSESDDDSPRWMSSRRGKMPKGGTLVVCPATLLEQWEREIYKRVKKRVLSVELYHGPKRETKPRRLAQYDVIITTYNLVSRESGVETAKNATRLKEKGPLFLVNWDRIILDEAHMVRNHKSLMALGVCELVGKHRWCLTGTPIQNKELDLYALLKFLQCSPFDDLVVWKRWVDNKNAAGMQRLGTMMKSLMLRRTKEQLHEKGDLDCLPEKTYERIDIHLDPEELELYEKVALFSSNLFAEFLHQRAEKQQVLDARYGMTTRPVRDHESEADNQFSTTEELAKMHRKMKGITEIKTHQILVLLLRLRQICCHPALVKQMVQDGDLDFNSAGVEDKSGLDVDLFNQMNNLNINDSDVENEEREDELNKSGVFSVDSPVLSLERPSAKIRAILDLIEEKLSDSEDKAIIVSQWTSVLNIIAKFLKQMQIRFASLTGDVPVDKRQEIVNSINKQGSGPQILLLSLTAGGCGLNLVGANHLLLVDIHWNPQLEAQACDRIYRVGQKKHVFIYRFITLDTVEERIKKIQDYKLLLAENVLTGTRNTEVSKLTLADLQMLFSAPAPSQPVPAKPEMFAN